MDTEKSLKTYVLFAVILAIAFTILLFNILYARNGDVVQVSVDGRVVKELPLSEDTEYVIEGIENGENVIIIKDRLCYMKSADCPDKLCMKQGKIEKTGQTIICLPHKVWITVKGKESEEIDSVAK